MEQTRQTNETGARRSRQIFDLAKELIDDIELNRLSGELLLLKGMRLSQLVGNAKIQSWLHYEMVGYGDAASYEYMGWAHRWTDYEAKKGYWYSFPQIEVQIRTMELELKALHMPTDSGENLNANLYHLTRKTNSVRSELVKLQGIKSRVVYYLHTFASNTYHEKAFSGLAETIFERYKMAVDAQLAGRCGEILPKLPYIYDRLAEGNPEAVSQALNTCRRVIDAFADSIFPPTDEKIEIDGNELQLGPENHKNRINAYIRRFERSDTRRHRLHQTLNNLYERVATGIHSDVTSGEARALFFATYLFLGEVLTLTEQG